MPVAQVTPFHTQIVNNNEGNAGLRPVPLEADRSANSHTARHAVRAADAFESQIGLQRKTPLLQPPGDSPFLGGARTSLDNRNHDR
jgi:hypothetical protein